MSTSVATCFLQGGIGNIMFQIAATIGYAVKHGKSVEFYYGLHQPSHHGSISQYSSNILQNLKFSNYNNIPFIQYSEPGFHYTEIPHCPTNIVLSGYFQSEKYFKHCETTVKTYFTYDIQDNKDINVLQEKNTCSLHVRRGDYLSLSQYHTTLDIEYYKRAVSLFEKNTVFIVMSDDINWCKEAFSSSSFSNYSFLYLENQKPHEDLFFAMNSKHNIIANSSFSWWGAWLNNNQDKLVVSPDPIGWFGPAYKNKSTQDILCPSWKSI